MKRIACISTLAEASGQTSGSPQLVEMYNSLRVFNRQHDVTGVFLVCQNLLLQILEGDAETLAGQIYRLGRDSRLQDTSVVYNSDISTPQFQGWTIRSLSDEANSHQTFLQKLRVLLGDKLVLKNESDKQRLASFFTEADSTTAAGGTPASSAEVHSIHQNTSAASKSFDQCVLSLQRWPKPSQLQLSHELIKLCSRLVGKPVLYERLCASGICASENVLQQHLRKFDQLGLLSSRKSSEGIAPPAFAGASNVTPLPRKPVASAASQSASPRSAPDRFSQLLRRFLATTKA